VAGLYVSLAFWAQYGVEPVCICPHWWLKSRCVSGRFGDAAWEANDLAQLEALHARGVLFAAPSKELDDLYVIDYAHRTDGWLVSNDQYRDHQRQRNLSPEWIEQRRIGFMFVRGAFIPSPDGIQRLERFVKETGVVVGGAPHLPPPVPAPLGALSDMAARETISVPAQAVPFIVGRGGSKIEQISGDSGAKVRVLNHTPVASSAGGGDKQVHVLLVGSPDAVSLAKALVFEMVRVAEAKLSGGRGGGAAGGDSRTVVARPLSPAAVGASVRMAQPDPVGMPVKAPPLMGRSRLSDVAMADDHASDDLDSL
jgi:hypothetical protein